MKKIIVIIFCQLFLSIKLYSQTNANISYKNCVKVFYSLLFKKNATIGELSKIYSDGGVDNEAQQFIADSLKRNNYNQELINKKRASINNFTPSII